MGLSFRSEFLGLGYEKTNISKMKKDYFSDRYSLVSVQNHFYFTRKWENIA